VREVCRSDKGCESSEFSMATNLTVSIVVTTQVLLSLIGHIGDIRPLPVAIIF
jgi:hypothetical protein